MQTGVRVPDASFKTGVRDESSGGSNPFRWQDMTTADDLAGKRVVVFSRPGALTPACATHQLPGYEKAAASFRSLGIDAVSCMSVNESFVMTKWAQGQVRERVQGIADGSGTVARRICLLVDKDNLEFGARPRRSAEVIDDALIGVWFEKQGRADTIPKTLTARAPETVLSWLTAPKRWRQRLNDRCVTLPDL